MTITALAVINGPVFGGPHNRTTIVAKLLEPHDVRTVVVLPEEPQSVATADRMRAAGLEVVRMPLHRTRKLPDPRVHLRYARALRRETRAMADLIHDRGIDVVDNNSLTNIHGALAARRAGIACVWELIDTSGPQLARNLYSPLVRHYSDAVLTTGVKVAQAHPGITAFGDRWITFYPSVDMERFRPDTAVRQQARAELGIPDDAVVIGNVSSISEMKGHRWFIEAAAKVRAESPNTRFVILGNRHAGRERYYESLWSQAEGLGLRLGHDLLVQDPGTRVHELEQAFDVFWMTSEPNSEGIPTAIGEAKALEIPVVTVDVGSCSECVTDGVSGYVVPPRDPDALVAATRPLVADEEARRQFGKRAREECFEQYDAERGAHAHKIAYEKAIAHRAAQRRRA